ncbi:hypothetical protein [Bacteroides rodentium]|uniref:hypothetical protein n=1 Tax=Bacteroides rodentium TaxID=691816 RepID=UPI001ADF6692|nr:hypothetical protein [Bacteroides rodentium]
MPEAPCTKLLLPPPGTGAGKPRKKRSVTPRRPGRHPGHAAHLHQQACRHRRKPPSERLRINAMQRHRPQKKRTERPDQPTQPDQKLHPLRHCRHTRPGRNITIEPAPRRAARCRLHGIERRRQVIHHRILRPVCHPFLGLARRHRPDKASHRKQQPEKPSGIFYPTRDRA